MGQPRKSIAHLTALTLSNVVLQVASATLIKTATLPARVGLFSALVVCCVLLLNFGRFVLWQTIHKRYDLSVAYPASALFFPCVVAASYLFGEHVDAWKMTGGALVTLGVVVLMVQARNQFHEAQRLAPEAPP